MTGILPPGQFDGQEFVDFYQVKWVFMSATQCWQRIGKVDSIPLANGTNVGLLPAKLKYLLDTVPDKGGGFALITKPLLAKRNRHNPDGVIFGDITLVSDSLQIDCVDADGNMIGDACKRVTFKEYDRQPPGFDINFSSSFLDAICVEVPGGPGQTGKDGLKGEPGEDGTGDGPVGLQGTAGKDATFVGKFTGIRIIDVDDIFDTAVAKIDLDAPNGKLYVTKAKMALPTDTDAAADQLIVAQIGRQVVFSSCFDYTLTKVPCRFNDDFDILDPLIAYYPASFNPTSVDGTQTFQLTRARLSTLINNIISVYQQKLVDAGNAYDAAIATFIQNKDDEARKVLDQLGDRLAECENITYLEYCVGIEGECNAPPPAPVTAAGPAPGQIAGNDPSCQPLLDLLFCTDIANSSCQNIGEVAIPSGQNPVLSFPSPSPGNAISQNPPTGLHDEAAILASFKQYEPSFLAAMAKGFIVYPKIRATFSGSTPLFPAGAYALIYESGAFRQEQRSNNELHGTDPSFMINGGFQNFYVGSQGANDQAQLCMIEPGSKTGCVLENTPFLNSQFGIEIGFAPQDYNDQIPPDYFTKHAYDVNLESGGTSFDLPLSRVDYTGLSDAIIAEEAKISWQQFIVLPEASTSDASALQAAYLNAILARRSVRLVTNAPGYIYLRVKPATCFLSSVGQFVMPPVYPQGSLGNGVPLFPTSFNKVSFVPQNGLGVAFINARPVTQGQVTFKIMSIDCKRKPFPGAPATGATGQSGSGLGTGANPNPAEPLVDNQGNEESAGANP